MDGSLFVLLLKVSCLKISHIHLTLNDEEIVSYLFACLYLLLFFFKLLYSVCCLPVLKRVMQMES